MVPTITERTDDSGQQFVTVQFPAIEFTAEAWQHLGRRFAEDPSRALAELFAAVGG